MTSPAVLLCMAVLLVFCSNSCASGSVNCRKFVYHPKCRGVAAKRADLPALFVHRPSERDADRRVDEEGLLAEPELVGLEEAVAGRPRGALWTFLADRPAAGLLLARAKHPADPDSVDLNLNYDYE